MSPSVARGLLNLQNLWIEGCQSMEEVISKEEQQGEGIMTLFPLLEELNLLSLPKLGHFFLTEHTLQFPFLRKVEISNCLEMKTFVQQRISMTTPSFESVNNDDEVKVVDLNKAMFNSKVSCPNLKELIIWELESISALCSHQLPTAYFSILETLHVSNCGNLRNLMSPSVARGALNLRRIKIENCVSMEVVITEEEQQGEEIMTLFPLLEMLELEELPKLRHFFLTKRVTEFPFLRELRICDCPEMKTFVQQGISVSTLSLKSVNNVDEVKVVDLNKAMFNSKGVTEFPFLRELRICDCPEMKTFVQQGISVSTPSLESVNNDDEVKVVDLNNAMFNSKISCPSLEYLYIEKANSISALYSHQHPTAYFSKLETLHVSDCGKLRNLMSPSVARSLLNLRILTIYNCKSMEEMITKEENQGEGIMTLFPLLEELNLLSLPKLGHFFLTEHALQFPFLRKVEISNCPEMKTFVQQKISMSTPSLESMNNDDEVKVVDLNKTMFNSKVSCPNLKELIIRELESISALCSHQLPTAFFSKLETLHVSNCGNLRNLMSSLVVRDALNLQRIQIENCVSMEEVITEEEQQGEEIMTLFPLLEMLELEELPKLRHFFLTKCVTEFPFLRELRICDCPEMKTFVQHGISVSTLSLKSVNNANEVKVVDLNKAMFNSKVSCPNLKELIILELESISALCSHQLPTAYFSKLETLHVSNCENLRNLMSPSVARGALNLRRIEIEDCASMEEDITEEEQHGEEIMTLFPLLEKLELDELPKLRHFFLTKRVTEFPFLREVKIRDCPEMKTFVQQEIFVSTPSLERVNNDDEVKVVDLNKSMFNSKISCPSLEYLCIKEANNISSLYSHQHPTAYFSKLEKLELWHCGKLRNLMSPSVARSLLNLRILAIYDCQSMEEVITKEEQQGEVILTLFPLLEDLGLEQLPKLGHFFLTEHALKFPFLVRVWIDDCPEMKTFVQQGISVSTPSLECLNDDYEVKVDDLNKWTQQRFNSKEQNLVKALPMATNLKLLLSTNLKLPMTTKG
ncbi:hypothetical protein MTR67_019974 [Solanum verrucosum]|uniref:Disease resistance protein At4g27190-like leucine-rich repeats domain-containing protein n=1 Tax=Solanum verrucosum TaxID=315347 RepID=A0AAF0TP10_SOLVR|nr:hypothetical protein MTR67_019974 [Solanum verrucosum]